MSPALSMNSKGWGRKSGVKVYFIGAGPGDPQLLTVKALEVIKKADVIIYAGSLINKAIIGLARRGIRLYDASTMNLDEIFRVMKKARSTAKILVRIHCGEPSIYGAIQENIDWCDKEIVLKDLIYPTGRMALKLAQTV